MLRGCFTQSFTEFFLKWIVLREMHRGGCFFCFRFVAQSFTEFYTEFHGVFFEVDGVERGSQRRCAFFVFLPRIKGLLGFF